MTDFIQEKVTPNEYGGIWDKPKKPKPKAGFIEARLNKDNLWNVVFLFITSVIVGIAQLLMNLIPGGVILLLVTIILAPYIVSRLNPVLYKDGMFHSASGRKLAATLPTWVGFVVFSGIPFTVFWIFFIHDKLPFLDENMAIYNAIFWFVPTIYFICKNYPISFLFNKKALTTPIPGLDYSSTYEGYKNRHNVFSRDISQLNSPYNRRHNPINSYSAINSHYRR